MIALTGAIRDFLQSPHCTGKCLQHALSSGQAQPCANHVHHIGGLLSCNMSCATWYEGTAQLLSLTELKSHLFSFILLAEPLTAEGGEETGVPGENPCTTSFRKCHILKPENPSPSRDSNPPHSGIGGRLGKLAC